MYLRRVARALRSGADHDQRMILVLLGLAHLALIELSLTGRAAYGDVPATPLWHASTSWWWPVGSALITAGLLGSPRPPRLVWVLWLSTGHLAAWAALNAIVGLGSGRPVSLMGPVGAAVLAAMSWVAADYWATRPRSGVVWTRA